MSEIRKSDTVTLWVSSGLTFYKSQKYVATHFFIGHKFNDTVFNRPCREASQGEVWAVVCSVAAILPEIAAQEAEMTEYSTVG